MHPQLERLQLSTRRYFLRDGALGLGAIALGSLAGKSVVASDRRAGALSQLHYPAKAKRVIYLHMTGSPPNLDLYDYKPELIKRNGEDCPESFLKGREFAFTTGVPKLLGTPQPFQRSGQAGSLVIGRASEPKASG